MRSSGHAGQEPQCGRGRAALCGAKNPLHNWLPWRTSTSPGMAYCLVRWQERKDPICVAVAVGNCMWDGCTRHIVTLLCLHTAAEMRAVVVVMRLDSCAPHLACTADPAVLATAPRLMRVAAPSCSLIWCVGLQRRRADVIVNGYSLADTNRFFAAGTDYPSGHGDNGHDSQDVGDPASSDDLRDPVTAYLLRGDLSEESSRGDGEASSGSEEGGRSGGSGSHSGSEEGDGEGSSDSSSEEGSRGSGEGRSGSEGAVSI